MAHDVFISYSSNDRNAALAVLHGLERAGIRCWMAPRDIKPGAIWAQAIMEGIEGARILVVVFSANANRSANVINEVDAAVRKGAIIVPLRIEDVMPEGAMEYHLRTRHWLDALTPDLTTHTARLAEQVHLLLQTEPAVRAEPPSAHRERPAGLPPVARRKRPARAPGEPRNWKRIGTLGGAGLVVLLAAGFALTRKRPVRDVEFTVHEVSSRGGNELTLRLKSEGLRFFEAGSNVPRLAERQYETRFAGSSRFVQVEVKLTYEAPGREVAVPMTCDLFTSGGQVYAAISITARIQPAWTESYHTQGWGTAQGGSWRPGKYRVECKYGGKLIGRDWFEIVAGGAPAPPEPDRSSPPPPPPLRPTPGSTEAGTLREIGARVRSIRFFESDYGSTPVPERRYLTRFAAGEARFINTEVTLQHPAPGRVVTTGITCRYLRDQLTEIGRIEIKVRIEPAWTTTISTGGWGGRNPGSWQPGGYAVVCDDGRSTVARGSFAVR